jgi:hypothetical protein
MRPYGSRDDAIPAAEVRLSLSQSQSLRDECRPLVRRRVEGTAALRMKSDNRRSRSAAVGGNMRAAG